MFSKENQPFVNPKAVELRSIRMSTRKRKLSKQKEAEEAELFSNTTSVEPESSADSNVDYFSDKASTKETTPLPQQLQQQISTPQEQQQKNTPKQSTTPQSQGSTRQTRSSSRQKSEILEQRIRKAGGRIPFSISDENELYEFLLNQSKHLRGNKIYEQLAKQNPRHTAQSWRNHALDKYIDKPHFIEEWKRKWFPSNIRKVEKEITTNITNKETETIRTHKEKKDNNNKESINEELFDNMESDDAAAEALILGILGQPIVQVNKNLSEEEEDDRRKEKSYSEEESEFNVEVDDEPLEDKSLSSDFSITSFEGDSGIEDRLSSDLDTSSISGKTGRQQDTSEIPRQDTLDFDVGPKQKGKRVRQDSEEEEEEEIFDHQYNTPPIRKSKNEKEFSYDEQDIHRLVNETRRPKKMCKIALQMSTYHYDTARELLLFGIRNEIHPRIWSDEEDELLLKHQKDLNNLNNIIDKHSIELTKERLSYLMTRNERNI